MTTTALADRPVAVCNRCGRTTWAQASIGTDDRMEHAVGGLCRGRFIATGARGEVTAPYTDTPRAVSIRVPSSSAAALMRVFP
jgi:hypothetical protein